MLASGDEENYLKKNVTARMLCPSSGDSGWCSPACWTALWRWHNRPAREDRRQSTAIPLSLQSDLFKSSGPLPTVIVGFEKIAFVFSIHLSTVRSF